MICSPEQVVVYLQGLYMRWRFINSHRVTPWNLEGNFTQNAELLLTCFHNVQIN